MTDIYFAATANYGELSDSDFDQVNNTTSDASEIDKHLPKDEVDDLLAEDGPSGVVEHTPALQSGPSNEALSLSMAQDIMKNVQQLQRIYETAFSRKKPFLFFPI